MTPSNLPPGVTDADIPSNRPEDAYWEGIGDALYEALANRLPHGISKDEIDVMVDELMDICTKVQDDTSARMQKMHKERNKV